MSIYNRLAENKRSKREFSIPNSCCPYRMRRSELDKEDRVGLEEFFCDKSDNALKQSRCWKSECPLLKPKIIGEKRRK